MEHDAQLRRGLNREVLRHGWLPRLRNIAMRIAERAAAMCRCPLSSCCARKRKMPGDAAKSNSRCHQAAVNTMDMYIETAVSTVDTAAELAASTQYSDVIPYKAAVTTIFTAIETTASIPDRPTEAVAAVSTVDTPTEAAVVSTFDTSTEALDVNTVDTSTEALDVNTVDTSTEALDVSTVDTPTEAVVVSTVDTPTEAAVVSTVDMPTEAVAVCTVDTSVEAVAAVSTVDTPTEADVVSTVDTPIEAVAVISTVDTSIEAVPASTVGTSIEAVAAVNTMNMHIESAVDTTAELATSTQYSDVIPHEAAVTTIFTAIETTASIPDRPTEAVAAVSTVDTPTEAAVVSTFDTSTEALDVNTVDTSTVALDVNTVDTSTEAHDVNTVDTPTEPVVVSIVDTPTEAAVVSTVDTPTEAVVVCTVDTSIKAVAAVSTVDTPIEAVAAISTVDTSIEAVPASTVGTSIEAVAAVNTMNMYIESAVDTTAELAASTQYSDVIPYKASVTTIITAIETTASIPDRPTEADVVSTVDTPTETVVVSTVDTPTEAAVISTVDTPSEADVVSTVDTPIEAVVVSTVDTPTEAVVVSTVDSSFEAIAAVSTVDTPTEAVVFSTVDTPVEAAVSTVDTSIEAVAGVNTVKTSIEVVAAVSTVDTPTEADVASTVDTPTEAVVSTVDTPIEAVLSTVDTSIEAVAAVNTVKTSIEVVAAVSTVDTPTEADVASTVDTPTEAVVSTVDTSIEAVPASTVDTSIEAVPASTVDTSIEAVPASTVDTSIEAVAALNTMDMYNTMSAVDTTAELAASTQRSDVIPYEACVTTIITAIETTASIPDRPTEAIVVSTADTPTASTVDTSTEAITSVSTVDTFSEVAVIPLNPTEAVISTLDTTHRATVAPVYTFYEEAVISNDDTNTTDTQYEAGTTVSTVNPHTDAPIAIEDPFIDAAFDAEEAANTLETSYEAGPTISTLDEHTEVPNTAVVIDAAVTAEEADIAQGIPYEACPNVGAVDVHIEVPIAAVMDPLSDAAITAEEADETPDTADEACPAVSSVHVHTDVPIATVDPLAHAAVTTYEAVDTLNAQYQVGFNTQETANEAAASTEVPFISMSFGIGPSVSTLNKAPITEAAVSTEDTPTLQPFQETENIQSSYGFPLPGTYWLHSSMSDPGLYMLDRDTPDTEEQASLLRGNFSSDGHRHWSSCSLSWEEDLATEKAILSSALAPSPNEAPQSPVKNTHVETNDFAHQLFQRLQIECSSSNFSTSDSQSQEGYCSQLQIHQPVQYNAQQDASDFDFDLFQPLQHQTECTRSDFTIGGPIEPSQGVPSIEQAASILDTPAQYSSNETGSQSSVGFPLPGTYWLHLSMSDPGLYMLDRDMPDREEQALLLRGNVSSDGHQNWSSCSLSWEEALVTNKALLSPALAPSLNEPPQSPVENTKEGMNDFACQLFQWLQQECPRSDFSTSGSQSQEGQWSELQIHKPVQDNAQQGASDFAFDLFQRLQQQPECTMSDFSIDSPIAASQEVPTVEEATSTLDTPAQYPSQGNGSQSSFGFPLPGTHWLHSSMSDPGLYMLDRDMPGREEQALLLRGNVSSDGHQHWSSCSLSWEEDLATEKAVWTPALAPSPNEAPQSPVENTHLETNDLFQRLQKECSSSDFPTCGSQTQEGYCSQLQIHQPVQHNTQHEASDFDFYLFQPLQHQPECTRSDSCIGSPVPPSQEEPSIEEATLNTPTQYTPQESESQSSVGFPLPGTYWLHLSMSDPGFYMLNRDMPDREEQALLLRGNVSSDGHQHWSSCSLSWEEDLAAEKAILSPVLAPSPKEAPQSPVENTHVETNDFAHQLFQRLEKECSSCDFFTSGSQSQEGYCPQLQIHKPEEHNTQQDVSDLAFDLFQPLQHQTECTRSDFTIGDPIAPSQGVASIEQSASILDTTTQYPSHETGSQSSVGFPLPGTYWLHLSMSDPGLYMLDRDMPDRDEQALLLRGNVSSDGHQHWSSCSLSWEEDLATEKAILSPALAPSPNEPPQSPVENTQEGMNDFACQLFQRLQQECPSSDFCTSGSQSQEGQWSELQIHKPVQDNAQQGASDFAFDLFQRLQQQPECTMSDFSIGSPIAACQEVPTVEEATSTLNTPTQYPSQGNGSQSSFGFPLPGTHWLHSSMSDPGLYMLDRDMPGREEQALLLRGNVSSDGHQHWSSCSLSWEEDLATEKAVLTPALAPSPNEAPQSPVENTHLETNDLFQRLQKECSSSDFPTSGSQTQEGYCSQLQIHQPVQHNTQHEASDFDFYLFQPLQHQPECTRSDFTIGSPVPPSQEEPSIEEATLNTPTQYTPQESESQSSVGFPLPGTYWLHLSMSDPGFYMLNRDMPDREEQALLLRGNVSSDGHQHWSSCSLSCEEDLAAEKAILSPVLAPSPNEAPQSPVENTHVETNDFAHQLFQRLQKECSSSDFFTSGSQSQEGYCPQLQIHKPEEHNTQQDVSDLAFDLFQRLQQQPECTRSDLTISGPIAPSQEIPNIEQAASILDSPTQYPFHETGSQSSVGFPLPGTYWLRLSMSDPGLYMLDRDMPGREEQALLLRGNVSSDGHQNWSSCSLSWEEALVTDKALLSPALSPSLNEPPQSPVENTQEGMNDFACQLFQQLQQECPSSDFSTSGSQSQEGQWSELQIHKPVQHDNAQQGASDFAFDLFQRLQQQPECIRSDPSIGSPIPPSPEELSIEEAASTLDSPTQYVSQEALSQSSVGFPLPGTYWLHLSMSDPGFYMLDRDMPDREEQALLLRGNVSSDGHQNWSSCSLSWEGALVTDKTLLSPALATRPNEAPQSPAENTHVETNDFAHQLFQRLQHDNSSSDFSTSGSHTQEGYCTQLQIHQPAQHNAQQDASDFDFDLFQPLQHQPECTWSDSSIGSPIPRSREEPSIEEAASTLPTQYPSQEALSQSSVGFPLPGTYWLHLSMSDPGLYMLDRDMPHREEQALLLRGSVSNDGLRHWSSCSLSWEEDFVTDTALLSPALAQSPNEAPQSPVENTHVETNDFAHQLFQRLQHDNSSSDFSTSGSQTQEGYCSQLQIRQPVQHNTQRDASDFDFYLFQPLQHQPECTRSDSSIGSLIPPSQEEPSIEEAASTLPTQYPSQEALSQSSFGFPLPGTYWLHLSMSDPGLYMLDRDMPERNKHYC